MNSSVAPPAPRERTWLMSRWVMEHGAPLLLLPLEAAALLDAAVVVLLDAALLLLDAAVLLPLPLDAAVLLPPAPPELPPNWNEGYPQPVAATCAAIRAASVGPLCIVAQHTSGGPRGGPRFAAPPSGPLLGSPQ